MFNLFNSFNRPNPKSTLKNNQEIKENLESKELLNLLQNSNFQEAKIFLEKNDDINKDKVIGLYLENILKNPDNDDFSHLYKFIESDIIDINEIKHNQFISMILTQAIHKFEKENNLNALSRLRNFDLIDDLDSKKEYQN